MKGPTTVVLKMGTAECTVHINRVRPLLMKDTQNPVAKQDWTPPLFTHENAEEQPCRGRTIHEPERPPSVLIHHQSSGPHPVITILVAVELSSLSNGLTEQRIKGGGSYVMNLCDYT